MRSLEVAGLLALAQETAAAIIISDREVIFCRMAKTPKSNIKV
jgi:hypothetical protein